MKRTLKMILFIGTFVLILALIGFIAIKMGQQRLAGEQGASAEYAILRNAVSPITSEQELGDQFVRDRLKSLYSASAHLLAVQVLDRNGLVLWKMPDESPYFASPATNPGSVFRAPGISTVIYMTPLPDGMKLMALYATLTQADISKILLLPIILLALWIALLVALQLTLKEKPEYARAEPAGAEPERTDHRPSEPATTKPLTSETPLSAAEPQPSPSEEEFEEMEDELVEAEDIGEEPPFEAEAEPEPDYEFESEDELEAELEDELEPEPEEEAEQEERAEPEEIEVPEAPHLESAPPLEPRSPKPIDQQPSSLHQEEIEEELEEEGEFLTPPPPSAPAQPKELFPPTIASHALEQSLGAELSRNQETALMLILCELTGESDPSALALGVTIRDYFATDSLVFELGRGCYAAVLPGADPGSSLKLAVDLDDVLTTTASLYKDLSDEPPFYFGISGRYERDIDPERLYREAYAALKHAHESGSRILAFKPAPPAV